MTDQQCEYDEHKAEMVREYGPLAADLYAYAYQEGHAYGHYEVETKLADLLERVEPIIKRRDERLRLLEAVVEAAQPYRSDMVTDASVLNDIARRDALTKACLALDNYDKEVG